MFLKGQMSAPQTVVGITVAQECLKMSSPPVSHGVYPGGHHELDLLRAHEHGQV